MTSNGRRTRALRAAERLRNRPARYDAPWGEEFRDAIHSRLRPGVAVLDVGSGRSPSLGVGDRPEGTHYVGLDPSRVELDAAASGVYDEAFVADVAEVETSLRGRFDLVVSWQVVEHVADVQAAFDNMRTYLKPRGAMILMFSGRWSPFAIAGRLIPFRLGKPIVTRIMKRSATLGPVFPAHYDKCYDTALRDALRHWHSVHITPYYRGAAYFNFSPLAFSAYVAYENAIAARRVANLATHYLVVAER